AVSVVYTLSLHDALPILLWRRGALLEELGRFDEAAEVWTRLTTVAAGDGEARERLRSALRKAGKQQDLLVALQRDLRRADHPSEDRKSTRLNSSHVKISY